jgi:uncharacterized membrane protein
MDKLIVTLVPNEAAAYAFLSSLEDLDLQASIELNATEVITKAPDGQLVRKAVNDQRGLGTVVGASVGGLLGMLAGPVGLAVGAVAGGASGFAGETVYSGVSGEFISGVSRSLAPGGYAVFAEADEDWTFPIDEAARNAGGKVFRQGTWDVVKAQMKAEDDAAAEELARLDAEIARSAGEAKAKLEAKREEAKAAQAERAKRRKVRSEEIQKKWDARVAAVQEKAEKASSDAKVRHQATAQKLSKFVQQEKAALKELFS